MRRVLESFERARRGGRAGRSRPAPPTVLPASVVLSDRREQGGDSLEEVGRRPGVALRAEFNPRQLTVWSDDRRAKVVNDFILPGP